MARKLTRISAADFAASNSTPVEILPAPPSGYYYFPRQLGIELVPGDVLFADGGVLQLLLGDVAAIDLTGTGTFYQQDESYFWFQDLGQFVNNSALVMADFVANPIKLKLKTADIDTYGGIATATKNAGGSGYAVNDEGTVDGGDVLATYKVLTVSTGAVATFSILTAGSGYQVANAIDTTATSGVGTGFKVNVTALEPTDGEIKAIIYYSTYAIG